MPDQAVAMAPGFADPVGDAQQVFRAILDATARPGRIVELPVRAEPPSPLQPASGAVTLTLLDFETPLWLDPLDQTTKDVADYIRFHCGCPLVRQPADARFALIVDGAGMPPLSAFNAGTPECPDQSTTVIVQVDEIAATGGVRLTGPGIASETRLGVQGLPQDFWAWSRQMQAEFPCGVDVLFVAGTRIAALPRSTRVGE